MSEPSDAWPRAVAAIYESGGEGRYVEPALTDQFALVPEPGERVMGVWVGTFRGSGVPEMPGTQFLVTDRRATWITVGYDRGGGYSGFGAAGLAASVAANAVSKTRAKKRSAGKALAGQARHEWLMGVKVARTKQLLGGVASRLELSFAGQGRPLQVSWTMPTPLIDDAASTLASAFSAHWLSHGSDLLTQEELDRLGGYRTGSFERAGDLDQRGWLPPRLSAVELLTSRRSAA